MRRREKDRRGWKRREKWGVGGWGERERRSKGKEKGKGRKILV